VLNEDATSDGDSFLQELDAATYGKLGAIGNNRIVAEAYLISELQPDPQQPRRVIPSVVRQMVDIHDMRATMDRWYHTAERELERSIPLRDLVEGKVEDGQFDTEGITHERYPVAASFLAVARLAGDILRDGLINPISIYRSGRTHMINKGERRWFAFHILYGLYGSKYERISAREESPSIWAQASENMSREDLGGVALARQFALLLMSLYPDQPWGNVADFTTDEGSDRLFYAQVGDGNEWRIPKNKGQKIADAMQASVNALRHYRQILGVPNVIWLEADDKQWSTNRLVDWIIETNKKQNPPRPFERKTPPAPPVTDNDTVWDYTVSPTQQTQNGNHTVEASTVSNPADDLPQGYSIANIDTGTGANVAVPQDEVTARIMRYSSVVAPLQEFEGALAQLAEVQSIHILRGEPEGKREDLLFQMVWVITCLLNFTEQLADSLAPAKLAVILSRYEIVSERFQELLIQMRTHSTGRSQSNVDTFTHGTRTLLENIKEKPDAHIEDRLGLVRALSEAIGKELEIIQAINGGLTDLSQLKNVEASLGEVDEKFWSVANDLKDRIKGA
jgi:hypothetical protein